MTVPGCVAGWDALRKRFGTMPFAAILAPAIYYAENGFPHAGDGARAIGSSERFAANSPAMQETYMPNGERRRGSAMSSRTRRSRESLRAGRRARPRRFLQRRADRSRLVAFLQAQGGAHTVDDFAEFQPEWVEPISTTYRGWNVSELPPNGQGIAALSMLNIMEHFPLADYGHNSAEALHVMIEAKKLAYADMVALRGRSALRARPREGDACRRIWPARRAELIRCESAPRARSSPSEITAEAGRARAARQFICRRSIKTATLCR